MASPGINDITPLIHHEKQEPGSALCAQHALNALLQEPIFSATDLSQIAQSLDELEKAFDEERGQASTNMDDTGFFSIQVLDKALDVWGLSLPRWRSETMRVYHDRPENQLAFILNLNQHWFTLRRFGGPSREPPYSDGNSHWFNLNSSFEAPQWISSLYLGMVLHQAEEEGYSVFAVVPKDPDAPFPLPVTDADRLASQCPPPSSSHAPENATSRTHATPSHLSAPEGFEDEDFELQAAIAASMGTEYYAPIDAPPPAPVPAPVAPRAPIPAPSLPRSFTADSDNEDDDDAMDEDLDPVEASRRRNARLLAQFQREQGAASRELDFDFDGERRRRRQQEEDEEEELRRAIAESEALARAEGHAPLDADVGEREPLPAHAGPPPRRDAGLRVYDDEDAELQAALRASLENAPPGFALPESPRASRPASPPSPPPPALASAFTPTKVEEPGAESEVEADEPESAAQEVDLAEMRRRRLARFGGGS